MIYDIKERKFTGKQQIVLNLHNEGEHAGFERTIKRRHSIVFSVVQSFNSSNRLILENPSRNGKSQKLSGRDKKIIINIKPIKPRSIGVK